MKTTRNLRASCSALAIVIALPLSTPVWAQDVSNAELFKLIKQLQTRQAVLEDRLKAADGEIKRLRARGPSRTPPPATEGSTSVATVAVPPRPGDPLALEQKWQKNYLTGKSPTGRSVADEDHRVKRSLKAPQRADDKAPN